MKRIKLFAITLAVIIGGLTAIGIAESTGVNWKGAAGVAMAFAPIAFVKKLKEKGAYETLDAETKAYVDNLESSINEWATDFAKGVLTEKALDDKLTEALKDIKALPPEFDAIKVMTDLKSTIEGFDQFQKDFNKKKGVGAQSERKSLSAALYEAASQPEIKAQIDKILANGGKQDGPLRFELKGFSIDNIQTKDAITESMADTILAAGSASHYTLTSDTGIISKIRKRILTYLENVTIGRLGVDKPYSMWIEELDEQGTPIFIGEGDDKTQLSVRYEEREAKAKKIAVYGKVTTEFLRYLSKLVQYVQNNLMKRMDIVTENQLFTGDNAGDNLNGLVNYATQFDGGKGVANGSGLVGLVHNPTYADVFRAIALQVQNSYGTPVLVWVPFDVLGLMDTAKATESGMYLIPPFRSADGNMVAGMRLVGTNALAGTGIDFIGGDTSVINVEFLQNASVQIGLDGNDFTKNKKTILMEQELVQFVSANDTKVLVKGTFAAALALIDSGS